jgi:hypothetical protein
MNAQYSELQNYDTSNARTHAQYSEYSTSLPVLRVQTQRTLP